MALRYFQQQEQSYVPTYAPIQPEIMSQTHQQIQQQGETFRQDKRDMLDLAAQNAISEFSTLPEEDRQYARERFEQARQNVRSIVEERGARNAMPFLDEEVRGVERDLQYHRLAAQKNKEIAEQTKDSKAGPGIINYVQNKPYEVEFDESGDPMTVKGGPGNEDILTVKNWKSFDEGGSSFLSDWKANKINKDEFRDGYVVSTSNEQVTQDEVLNATRQFFLNDGQYRAQLKLKGKKLLDQSVPKNEDGIYQDEHLNMEILQNEAGNVTGIRSKIHEYERKNDGTFRRDENGDKIVKKTHDVQYDSIAEWQATEQAAPYAKRESYQDVGLSIKSSPLSSGTSREEEQGNPYTVGTWGVNEPETTYIEEWKNRMTEYEKKAGERFSTQKSELAHVVSAGAGGGDVSVEVENGQVSMTRKVENKNGHIETKKVTEEDIDEKFLPAFRDTKANLIQADRKMRNDAQKFQSIRKGVTQNLRERFGSAVSGIKIGEKGNLSFKAGSTDEIITLAKQQSPSDIHEYKDTIVKQVPVEGSKRTISKRVPREQTFNHLEQGEIEETTIRTSPNVWGEEKQRSLEGEGVNPEDLRETEVLVFKDSDGKVKFINKESNNILSDVQKVADRFMDKSTNNMFGTGKEQEYNIAYLNKDAKKGTIDSRIQKHFEENLLPNLGGTFRDTNNPDNELKPTAASFFDPVGTFYRDGKTVIAGAYYPSGKEDTDSDEVRNVIYEGSGAESFAEQRNPKDVALARFDQQFRNSITPIVHEGKTTMNINEREMRQMGLETDGEPDFNKLEINQSTKFVDIGTDDYGTTNVYTVTYETADGEKGSFPARTLDEIENRILNLSKLR